jgi:CoA:oxalate CoA-transferase
MPLVERLFTERTTDEWLERLQGAGVPATPIQSVDRVLADSQVRHRRMVVDVEHPRHGRLPTLGTPIKVDGRMGLDVTVAPRLGQHTDEILAGRLKYSGECVAALRQQGVIA